MGSVGEMGSRDPISTRQGLFGLVKERLGLSLLSGHLFLFANARRNRLKVLYWDGTGLWICSKRLERGRFSWPADGDENGKVQLSYEELALLVGGIELGRTRRKNWYRREEALRAENMEENTGN